MTAPTRTLPPPDSAAVTAMAPPVGLAYLPGLDGVRALSIIAVLLYHAGSTWLPGGYLGVEVFFVISGYLITLLLVREREQDGRVSLRGFWQRRARRLLPALFTMLVVVAVTWAFFVREELARLRGDLLASAFYVMNWHLIASDQSYFDQLGRPSPLRHVWSLAIEEQFYLLWPLVVVGLLFLLNGRRRTIAGVMIAGAVASFVWMQVLYDPGADPSRVYYGTDTRASALLLGGALALLWPPRRGRLSSEPHHAWLEAIGATGLVVLVALFATLVDQSTFLYRGGFLLCSLATLAVIVAVARPTWCSRLFGMRPLVAIGLRSYGLYLWHWPVYMLTRPGIDFPDLSWRTITAIRLVATVTLTELSYRLIEQPARRGAIGRWLASLRGPASHEVFRRRRLTLGAAVAAAVVLLPAVGVFALSRDEPNEIEASLQAGIEALADQPTIPLVTVAPGGDVGVVPQVTAGGADATVATSVASSAVAPATSPSTAPTSGVGSAPRGTASTVPASAPTTVPGGVTTAPVGTVPPTVPAPTIPVIAIGDSVMLGAAGQLKELFGPAGYVDAAVGRPFSEGTHLLGVLRAGGVLGGTVIVHLGNNGPIRAEQVGELMQVLKDVPQVIFLTVRLPGKVWEGQVNSILAQEVPKYPNAELLDWNGITAGRNELFYNDGIHLRPAGQRLYAELAVQAASA